MEAYQSGPELSNGFISEVIREGLGPAMANRKPYGLTTEPGRACGSLLHCWIQGETGDIVIARTMPSKPGEEPVDLKNRLGGDWKRAVLRATVEGRDGILLRSDHESVQSSWISLWLKDTPAKATICKMLREWPLRFAEVSHRWTPDDDKTLAVCRIRKDLVCQSSAGHWYGIGIKITKTPLAGPWWPFWRKYYRRAAGFYRRGLEDLFQDTPFGHLLIVARLVPPFPWALFDLRDPERSDEIELAWENETLPVIKSISQSWSRRESFGDEERGLL